MKNYRVPASKGLLYTVFSALVIVLGTLVVIAYAKGSYRLTQDGIKPNTGLLTATSVPTAAQVFLNDQLVTATDDTLYLEPGEYQVRIEKDGYSPWQKTLQVENELVTQTLAKLFPRAPKITPITFAGIENPLPSPDGQKLLYYTASASASDKIGLYVLELTDTTSLLQRGPRQLLVDASPSAFRQAEYIWSPDSSELLVITKTTDYLIEANRLTTTKDLINVRAQRSKIIADWEQEIRQRESQYLEVFPPEIIGLATASARNVYVSPDKKRLIYTANQPLTLPEQLIPPVLAANSQPQQRQIVTGGIYIYDREEDRNFQINTPADAQPGQLSKFLLGQVRLSNLSNPLSLSPTTSTRRNALVSPSPTPTIETIATLNSSNSAELAANFRTYYSPLFAGSPQWFPDSRHLITADKQTITIREYDGTNQHQLYDGPFYDSFVYPWPDGSRLLVLTSFSPNSPLNLYAIELK